MTNAQRLDEQMKVLRQRFRARCPEQSRLLVLACESRNLNAIRSLAHGITGSAGLFGFDELSRQAAQVSDRCRSGDENGTLLAALALSAHAEQVGFETD